MKRFGSSLFAQAIRAAGVGAALMLSVSVGHAQSGPFAGFNGAWTGNGTVALSDGTTERIRCKADYRVNGTGLGLKQTLKCASDSYKFDLTSDVTSEGDRISGNWSEAEPECVRRTARHRRRRTIEVFVEANGFAANLTLTDQRQQADRADQLEGRDPGRQHHDGKKLTPTLFSNDRVERLMRVASSGLAARGQPVDCGCTESSIFRNDRASPVNL